jgi:hypothetical protein
VFTTKAKKTPQLTYLERAALNRLTEEMGSFPGEVFGR